MNTIDSSKIRTLLADYEKALNESDADAAAVYAPDGRFYPYNLPTATGSDVVGSYRQIFSEIKFSVTFDIHEITVRGDLAYATTGSKGRVTLLAPGVSVDEENREMFVFTKAGRQWKIARYMFNKPTAPAVPGA